MLRNEQSRIRRRDPQGLLYLFVNFYHKDRNWDQCQRMFLLIWSQGRLHEKLNE